MRSGGKIYLVGSGEGDPGLVPWRGVEALRRAGAVAYDPGVPGALLALAPAGCERWPAGAEPPAAVAGRLREWAAGGRRVVRLYRGDPAADDRAKAEAEALAAAGQPFILVPGPGTAGYPRWYRPPLAGRGVLVTRSQSQAGDLAEAFRELGARVLEFEAIAVADPPDWAAVDGVLERLGQFDWVVFTSPNGVERFMGRLMGTRQADARALAGARLAAVGPGTAAALGRYGLVADLVPTVHRGEALAQALRQAVAAGDRVLVVRPEQAAVDMAAALGGTGCAVVECVVYRTVAGRGDAAALRRALAAGEVHYATFLSGSAVTHTLAAAGGPEAFRGVAVAVIGPQTAQAARAAGLQVDVVAPAATPEALVAAVAGHAAGRPAPPSLPKE